MRCGQNLPEEARKVAAASVASLDIAHLIKTWRGEKPKDGGIMAAARDARYALLADCR